MRETNFCQYTNIFIIFFFIILNITHLYGQLKGNVIIFHAGSLTIPFVKMEEKFEAMFPGVNIIREASGSRRCARKVTDLKMVCDIVASADYTVIDQMLIPEYADWNIRFAANRLVLCYTNKSKYANKMNGKNWFNILAQKGVSWGHSDPNVDPCGYRSLMVLQLAEKHYKKPGLYKRLIDNRPKENIRPKSKELIGLLQTGHMDYAWEYHSVAVQYQLKFVELPDKINLGNYRYDNYYKQAAIELPGKNPGDIISKRGKSCTYGITILKSAPNKNTAIFFLQYLLKEKGGLNILAKMGQPPFVPARVSTKAIKNLLPKSLQNLVEVKK